MQAKSKKTLKVVAIILAVIVVLGAACGIYLSFYYHADETAIAACNSTSEVTVTQENDRLIFTPTNATRGLVFYPGGQVEYTAYAPLMQQFAKNGFLCVLIKMPCNLAVFNVNAAEGVVSSHPEITTWSIAGHSLGGAMASSYVASHNGEFDNLLLLAAYSTEKIENCNVVSVYGSCDGVMQRDKYEEYRSNLPEGFTEYVIEGGNHASYGYYGAQNGDNEATISRAQQIETAVNAFLAAAYPDA